MMDAEQWLRVAVSVPTEAVELVSHFLVELGSAGIAEGEWKPDTPPPAWTLVQGFFFHRPGRRGVGGQPHAASSEYRR